MKLFLIGKYPEKKDTEEYTKNWLKVLDNNKADYFYRKIFFKEQPIKSILKIPYFCILLFTKKPDIVHAQYYADVVGPLFPLFLLTAKLRFKTKTILLVHEKPDFLLKALPKYLQKIYLVFEKINFNLADHLITHTQDAKNSIIKNYKINNKKISIVPHPWPEPIKILEDKNKLKQKYNIEKNFIFTIFGRVVPKKGHDTIIPLMKNLNAGLIIAGPTPPNHKPYLEKLKQQIENLNLHNVYILDFLNTSEISEIFQITDVSLFPYRSVTQSGVFATSLAHEVPVIAYNLPGFSELMDSNEIGLLVDNQNSDAFYQAMNDIIQNENKLTTYKQNIQKIKSEYSYKKIIYIYNDLYEKL